VIYNIIYVTLTNKKIYFMRTMAYNVGAGIAIALYGKAFFAMNK